MEWRLHSTMKSPWRLWGGGWKTTDIIPLAVEQKLIKVIGRNKWASKAEVWSLFVKLDDCGLI